MPESQSSMGWLRMTAVVLAGVLLAACGSTFPQAASVADQPGEVPAGDGLAVDGDGLGAPSEGTGSAPGTNAAPGGAPADPSAPGGPTAAGAPPKGAGRAGTPGVEGSQAAPGSRRQTAEDLGPVRLGYVITDLTGAASVFGAEDYNADEETRATEDLVKALIKYGNDTGGIGGRRIEGYETRVTLADGLDENRMLAKCVEATEDHKVDAMLATDSFASSAQLACFASHQTFLLTQVHSASRDDILAARPYVATTMASPERAELALIEGLHRAGFFAGAKLGVIIDDEPVIRRVYDQLMVPALQRLGVTVEAVHAFEPLDPGRQSAQASNAVLDFKTRGVNRVLVATNILSLVSFANAEQSQDYYAQLGIGDYQIAASAAPSNARSFPSLERALRDAIGVSVLRVISDRPQQAGSGIPRDRDRLGPGLWRCIRVLSKYTGKDYFEIPSSQRGRGWTAYCDSFFLWLETARLTGAPMTRQSWGLPLPSLGSSFDSAIVHRTSFAPTKYDGAGDYRVGRYYHENMACDCYKALFREYFTLPDPDAAR